MLVTLDCAYSKFSINIYFFKKKSDVGFPCPWGPTSSPGKVILRQNILFRRDDDYQPRGASAYLTRAMQTNTSITISIFLVFFCLPLLATSNNDELSSLLKTFSLWFCDATSLCYPLLGTDALISHSSKSAKKWVTHRLFILILDFTKWLQFNNCQQIISEHRHCSRHDLTPRGI